MTTLTKDECNQIATILERRANEVAGYCEDNKEKYPREITKLTMPASVQYALELEIKRLRALAGKIRIDSADETLT